MEIVQHNDGGHSYNRVLSAMVSVCACLRECVCGRVCVGEREKVYERV